eukprot:9467515-Pyramimonas_sp.AAC.1
MSLCVKAVADPPAASTLLRLLSPWLPALFASLLSFRAVLVSRRSAPRCCDSVLGSTCPGARADFSH